MTKNILVTGSNSGFGLVIAKTFASAGHRVHATLRNPEKAAPLEALQAAGLPVSILQLDVTDPDSIARAVEAARRDAPIDVLVNNAGFEVRAPIEQLSDESYRRQFDTNVLGIIRMVRAVAPAMRERGSGRIVNLSSVSGHIATPFAGAYSASKHAVEALSEALWYELSPFGVRVVLVEPGGFPTQFVANIVTDPGFGPDSPYAEMAERFHAAMQSFFAAGGAQDPQEIADIIMQAVEDPNPKLRYLAGNDARMLVPLYRSMEFEGFARAMTTRLGITAYPHLHES